MPPLFRLHLISNPGYPLGTSEAINVLYEDFSSLNATTYITCLCPWTFVLSIWDQCDKHLDWFGRQSIRKPNSIRRYLTYVPIFSGRGLSNTCTTPIYTQRHQLCSLILINIYANISITCLFVLYLNFNWFMVFCLWTFMHKHRMDPSVLYQWIQIIDEFSFNLCSLKHITQYNVALWLTFTL